MSLDTKDGALDRNPLGWKHVSLGELFEQVTDTGHQRDLTVLSVSVSGQVLRREDLERRLTGEVNRDQYFRVRPGDLVYNTMRLWQGACGLVREEGYVSPAYTVCRPKEHESSLFWAQAFQSERYVSLFERFSQGLTGDRLRLYFHLFEKIPALRPPFEEQRLIAQILDTLDDAIRKTEQLVAKLKLVKQGLLHDLLTRGVAENGELRDPERHPEQFKESPLGRIPREWGLSLVRNAGQVQLGRQRAPQFETGRNQRPYLRVANVYDGWIDYSDIRCMNFTPKEQEHYALNPGDVLLNEGQSIDLVGRSAIYEEEAGAYCFQNTLIRFRADKGRCFPEYARALFKFWLDQGRFMMVARQTTSVAHLGADRFAGMLLALPPLDEQARITALLKALQGRLREESTGIAKLRLLKAGLMDDLLTGRVRVTPLLDSPP